MARQRLLIKKSALEHNLKLLADQVGGLEKLVPVVKANAYGHGLTVIVNELEHLGIKQVAVATVAEAISILNSKFSGDIWMIHGFLPDELEQISDWSRVVVQVSSLDDVRKVEEIATKSSVCIKIIAHIDTGMNRLGLRPDDVAQVVGYIQNSSALELHSMMTHFASAGDDNAPVTDSNQWAILQNTRIDNPALSDVKIHVSNTEFITGHWGQIDQSFDFYRVGLAMYGYNLFGIKELRPIATLQAQVLHTFVGKKGEYVGYGSTYKLEKDTRLATLAIGYAEGLPRELTDKHSVSLPDIRCSAKCPVVGRISMNLTTIDVTDANVKKGDWLDVIGGLAPNFVEINISLKGWPYEGLCRLDRDIERVVV